VGDARFGSDQVVLRALEPTDIDALHAYLNDPQLLGRRYLPGGVPDIAPLAREQVVEILEAWTKAKKSLELGIERRDTGALVGHAGCDWNWDAHCPTVWITVAPEHQRAGIGSETLTLLLAHLFEETPAHNVHGWVDGWNEPGLSFARRHGFTPTGRIPRRGIREGAYFEEIMLDILRPEWVVAKEGPHGA
jgi:RimJ/RimL family protein N-acetyltransferase